MALFGTRLKLSHWPLPPLRRGRGKTWPFITNIPGLAPFEVETLKILNSPNEILVLDLEELNAHPDSTTGAVDLAAIVAEVKQQLYREAILVEYYI